MANELFILAQKYKGKYFTKLANSDIIDLTKIECTYSAIMRELRKQCDQSVIDDFLSIFKHQFDHLVLQGEDKVAEKALPSALMLFGKKYTVELK